MNRQSQWLFEAPFGTGTTYSKKIESEDELQWLNEYESEQLETNQKYWSEPTSNYFDRDESPFPDVYRWPKQSTFKVPPAETIKTGPYQTALCPAFDDFLKLRELVRALKSNLGTRPQIPKGLRDRQAIQRWQKAIGNWEKNIKAWEREIEVQTREMSRRLQNKSYVGQRCTKIFFRDLAKKVNSLRGSWIRSGTMLNVRQAVDRRLVRLRNAAVDAAK